MKDGKQEKADWVKRAQFTKPALRNHVKIQPTDAKLRFLLLVVCWKKITAFWVPRYSYLCWVPPGVVSFLSPLRDPNTYNIV